MPDAVIIPGRLYGPAAGLLMYSAHVAELRGTTVHRHEWRGDPPTTPDVEDWVCASVTPLLDSVAGRPLLIGKSLDSYAAALAADRGLPAVWLTPLLHVPAVPDADHGMYVPGPLTASVAVLGRVVLAVEEFLDAIGWPG